MVRIYKYINSHTHPVTKWEKGDRKESTGTSRARTRLAAFTHSSNATISFRAEHTKRDLVISSESSNAPGATAFSIVALEPRTKGSTVQKRISMMPSTASQKVLVYVELAGSSVIPRIRSRAGVPEQEGNALL